MERLVTSIDFATYPCTSPVSYTHLDVYKRQLLVCMLPLFCSKLANAIFVDLTSYKNLMISKGKILGVMDEPEESGSMEALRPATHEIIFDHVDFAYVPGEPVLKSKTVVPSCPA